MRVFLVVLDGIGIGPQEDADEYGDRGRNTMLHLLRSHPWVRLRELERLGLGRLVELPGAASGAAPRGAFGRMRSRSKGKDSLIGHWEIAGLVTDRPMPSYPEGAPVELLDRLAERTGRGWLGNLPGSGLEIVERFGSEHERSGSLVVRTSEASVVQFAAHRDVVPPAELYRVCGMARDVFVGQEGVGRIVARPFEGRPGAYRQAPGRREFAMPPPRETLLDRLASRGEPVISVGKVGGLFGGRGIAEALDPGSLGEAMDMLAHLARRARRGLVFANLLDPDHLDGARAEGEAIARALEQVDSRLPETLGRLRRDDLLLVTADHGCDPLTPGGRHAREEVPILAAGPRVRGGADLGVRATLADAGATAAEIFGAGRLEAGRSFLAEIRS